MAKPQNLDKLVLSIVATLVAVTALSLIVAGSFVPRWARPLNVSRTDANTTYSLWGREDCYGLICTTKYREEHTEVKTTWIEDGQKHVKITQSVDTVPITTCVEANYCNITWYEEVDFNKVPSLLFVARAFIIPSFCSGLVCIILYIVKIIMLVLRPSWRRIHIKAAYLTFSAVAGVSAGIAVVIFVTMLEAEVYELLWAPALPGVGGLLFICISIGGYLSWRNHSTDEDFDERSDFTERASSLYEFTATDKDKQKNGVTAKGYHRTLSHASEKSDIL
ncbi:hypothetical protein BsWGS_04004 [Bradybaena similaris]